jgi:hypothetical protein
MIMIVMSGMGSMHTFVKEVHAFFTIRWINESVVFFAVAMAVMITVTRHI